MKNNQSKMRCKRGFTLIELLVVVLIIGILAAVAVPQYQLAVDKTRFAKLRSLATTYARVARLYYETNGTYPQDISAMDIDFPGGMTSVSKNSTSCAYNTEFYCCINPYIDTRVAGSVTCGQQDDSFAIRITLGKSVCVANSNNSNAVRLCNLVGRGNGTEMTMWPFPGGYKSGLVYELIN